MMVGGWRNVRKREDYRERYRYMKEGVFKKFLKERCIEESDKVVGKI